MESPVRTEKRRVRFSEKNDVHVFEMDGEGTNSFEKQERSPELRPLQPICTTASRLHPKPHPSFCYAESHKMMLHSDDDTDCDDWAQQQENACKRPLQTTEEVTYGIFEPVRPTLQTIEQLPDTLEDPSPPQSKYVGRMSNTFAYRESIISNASPALSNLEESDVPEPFRHDMLARADMLDPCDDLGGSEIDCANSKHEGPHHEQGTPDTVCATDDGMQTEMSMRHYNHTDKISPSIREETVNAEDPDMATASGCYAEPAIREDTWSSGSPQHSGHERDNFSVQQATGRKILVHHSSRAPLRTLSQVSQFSGSQVTSDEPGATGRLLDLNSMMEVRVPSHQLHTPDGTTGNLLKIPDDQTKVTTYESAKRTPGKHKSVRFAQEPTDSPSALRRLRANGPPAALSPASPAAVNAADVPAPLVSLQTPTRDAPDPLGLSSPASSSRKANKRCLPPSSSPLRQVSCRLRTTTPRLPFPTTGTPLHVIREESGSGGSDKKRSPLTFSPNGPLDVLRVLPFAKTPDEQPSIGPDADEMEERRFDDEEFQHTPPVAEQQEGLAIAQAKLVTSKLSVEAVENAVDIQQSAVAHCVDEHVHEEEQENGQQVHNTNEDADHEQCVREIAMTGCILKSSTSAVWKGQTCIDVLWKVSEQVDCLFRFIDAGPRHAIFFQQKMQKTKEDTHLSYLLKSCLHLEADGRYGSTEPLFCGPAISNLKWCSAVVRKLEGIVDELSWLPLRHHMVSNTSVSPEGLVSLDFLCLETARFNENYFEGTLQFLVGLTKPRGAVHVKMNQLSHAEKLRTLGFAYDTGSISSTCASLRGFLLD